MTGEDVEAKPEVLPENPGKNHLLHISVRGRDHPDVHRDGAGAADALDFPALQHPQESDLGLGRQFSDFVQEDAASVGAFETTPLLGDGAREGPPFMAEEFAVHETVRNGAAIHLHQGTDPRDEVWWMAFAMISLPTPVSPRSITGLSRGATCRTSSITPFKP